MSKMYWLRGFNKFGTVKFEKYDSDLCKIKETLEKNIDHMADDLNCTEYQILEMDLVMKGTTENYIKEQKKKEVKG